MPIASALAYVKGLLDGLPMPAGLPPMAAYIDAPDPNVESEIPTAYIWPTNGEESRDGPAGTMPRNTGPGTPSGDKTITHTVDAWIVYFGTDTDEDADSLFPGVVDAVMAALRTAFPNPQEAVDPYTGDVTLLADTGEKMHYLIDVRATADQRQDAFYARVTLTLTEVITA